MRASRRKSGPRHKVTVLLESVERLIAAVRERGEGRKNSRWHCIVPHGSQTSCGLGPAAPGALDLSFLFPPMPRFLPVPVFLARENAVHNDLRSCPGLVGHTGTRVFDFTVGEKAASCRLSVPEGAWRPAESACRQELLRPPGEDGAQAFSLSLEVLYARTKQRTPALTVSTGVRCPRCCWTWPLAGITGCWRFLSRCRCWP
jgi:hypothetical protein